ncbi:tannase/feruloyl esterase family alpha/beta hydrolase [Paraburkholderia dilworthii]|uniref:tannase/feruloyl esterase family alpha/beta hydrolase n=1 Tax=Paraburkholderia dilworthii TaxID=948106 RepID=UPI0004881A9A|nr:tannase/feruloyl esterase family alpha/beta hydrolase [Paraburkholderia dilworthii]
MKSAHSCRLNVARAIAVLAISAACASGMAATLPTVHAAACERLLGFTVPAYDIGLPTSGASVTAVKPVAASGSGASALPEYCEITGKISPVDRSAPDIQFKVALPARWNDKVVMLGGGGFDGTIPDVTGNVPNGPVDKSGPLGRGYATFASDSGHQANALGSQDGRFGLNDEAVRNFGGDALKKTRDAALAIIKARYSHLPREAYFAGGSTGGREAVTAIQRWPSDWNGAIAWYPAWDDAAALLGGQRMSRALAKPGAYLSVGKRQAVYDAAMQACDALDGVVDGLISDQQQCNARFEPSLATLSGAPLRCPKGADTGENCLSDAQIEALNAINTPTHFRFWLASGETQYPGYNVWGADLGITSRMSPVEPVVTFLAFGTSQPANPMPLTAPYISVLTDQWIKYSVTRDPNFDSLSLDPQAPGVWANRISRLSSQLDANRDISAFKARGGKLLLVHGLVDVLVSTRATEEYYRRLQAQFGAAQVRSFVRFYEIPGMGHAASSTFNATWDSLSALEDWVERRNAPVDQVTTDTAGVPGRTRPLCEYPTWPRYEAGDVNRADSFKCAE